MPLLFSLGIRKILEIILKPSQYSIELFINFNYRISPDGATAGGARRGCCHDWRDRLICLSGMFCNSQGRCTRKAACFCPGSNRNSVQHSFKSLLTDCADGKLNVTYRSRNKEFENFGSSDKVSYLLAFLNGCEHFIENISRGYQLIVVYDLFWTNVTTAIPKYFPVFFGALQVTTESCEPWRRNLLSQPRLKISAVK